MWIMSIYPLANSGPFWKWPVWMSAAHDLRAIDAFGGVSGIYDKLGLTDDAA